MLLQGRKGVILGVANKRSIAWAIARSAHAHGAELALTYANDRFKEGVQELGDTLGVKHYLPCDVGRDEDIAALARGLEHAFGKLDFLVHAVAFAKKEELAGGYVDTSREGYHVAQDISSFSLVALCKAHSARASCRCRKPCCSTPTPARSTAPPWRCGAWG